MSDAKARRDAKIKAEYEKLQSRRAEKKDATPTTRAGTPQRDAPPSSSAGGAAPGVTGGKAKAKAKAKSKAKAKASARGGRSTTPPRGGDGKGAAAVTNSSVASDAPSVTRKERRARTPRAGGDKAHGEGAPRAGTATAPPARSGAQDVSVLAESVTGSDGASSQQPKVRASKKGKGGSKKPSSKKSSKQSGQRSAAVASAAGRQSGASVAVDDDPDAHAGIAGAAAGSVAATQEDPPPPPAGRAESRRPQPQSPQRSSNSKKQPTTPRRFAEGDGANGKLQAIITRIHAVVSKAKLNDRRDLVELQGLIKQAAEARLDLNSPGTEGTAVYLAAANGHAKAVELLRQNGADIMQTGSMGVTPLFIACYKGYHKVVSCLVQWMPRDERQRVIRDYKVKGELIATRGDIFVKEPGRPDGKGLVAGIIQGNEFDWPRTEQRQVKLPMNLLRTTTERDIQLSKGDADGSTPFFIACQEGRADIVRILCDAGVDIETPDRQGATPFYSACQNGCIDVVRHLFGKVNPRSGEVLDPERPTNDGDKPLDAARSWQNYDIVRFLSEPYYEQDNGAAHKNTRATPEVIPRFNVDVDDVDSDTDDERDLIRQHAPPQPSDVTRGALESEPTSTAPDIQPPPEARTIRRGKTKTLDLAMRRRGSVYTAGFLVEEEESEEFEVDGEEEDETRLRLTQVRCNVIQYLYLTHQH